MRQTTVARTPAAFSRVLSLALSFALSLSLNVNVFPTTQSFEENRELNGTADEQLSECPHVEVFKMTKKPLSCAYISYQECF